MWLVVSGTIAPAREIPEPGAEFPIHVLLSNLNLVVPVAAAILVIIIAIIVICVLRGKSSHHKGKTVLSCIFTGTIAPPEKDVTSVNKYFGWLPEWLDLNIIVPLAATVVVIIVGVIVICVAISRRSRGPEQTRLRGTISQFFHENLYGEALEKNKFLNN